MHDFRTMDSSTVQLPRSRKEVGDWVLRRTTGIIQESVSLASYFA